MTYYPFYMERFFAKKRQHIPYHIDELLHTLFLATNDMRIEQKAYFKTRCSMDLQKAKNAECYVDAILQELDNHERKEKSSLCTDISSLQNAQTREEMWDFLAPLLCSLVQHSDEGITNQGVVKKLQVVTLEYTTPEERKEILLQHKASKVSYCHQFACK